MYRLTVRLGLVLGLALSWVDASYALDSYRFLHVTIETPWTIFLFLLFTMFVPFILMAALVWRYAEKRKAGPEDKRAAQSGGEE